MPARCPSRRSGARRCQRSASPSGKCHPPASVLRHEPPAHRGCGHDQFRECFEHRPDRVGILRAGCGLTRRVRRSTYTRRRSGTDDERRRAIDDGPVSHAPEPRIRLTRRARHTILTVHIAASVALLGDVLGLAAIAVRARDDSPAAAATAGEIMSMMSFLFGIPLSLIALVTGIVLGVGSRWGVLRHWWVTVKLVALVAVMAVGVLVVGPAEGRLADSPTNASPDVIVMARSSRPPCSSGPRPCPCSSPVAGGAQPGVGPCRPLGLSRGCCGRLSAVAGWRSCWRPTSWLP